MHAVRCYSHVDALCRLGLRVLASTGRFSLKSLRYRDILSLALCYGLCTPLSNLSLAHNSVGFYQLMKIMTTPYVAALEYYQQGATYSFRTLVALVVVVLGVLLASVNDVQVCSPPMVLARWRLQQTPYLLVFLQLNALGVVYSTACMLVTAQYQVLIGRKQRELGASSLQLLAAILPLASIVTLVLMPFLDSTGFFFSQRNALVDFPFTKVIPRVHL